VESPVTLELPDAVLDEIAERAAKLVRPKLLSKQAFADYLGVKPRTVETWRAKGMPGCRVGKTVMFPVEECERWIGREGVA
jgi:hypothetical protein